MLCAYCKEALASIMPRLESCSNIDVSESSAYKSTLVSLVFNFNP